MTRAAPVFATAAMVLLVLAATALALDIAGYDATLAMRALWRGSFGSWFAFGSATLVRAVPLVLAGLAVALAFRAGIWNIGAEGQLLAGAAAATAAALMLGGAPPAVTLTLVLAAGIGAGAIWAGIAAALRRRFGVLEVISTIMLNFVALHLVSFLVRGPLQEPLGIYPQSPTIPPGARLPLLASPSRLHAGLLLAVMAAPALWWMLRATAFGLRLRAVGASPRAARSAGGIAVDRVVFGAFLLSGALAGLAGAAEVSGVTYALYENLSPGYGYSAIAIALLARLDPLGVVASGIFFAGLESGALAMQRDAGVPSVVVYLVEAVLILLVLAMPATRRAIERRLPASAVGVPDETSA
ncbi:MAG TPA: ABC transporter permease [Gemmatimonadaceae bacterium]|nr:ABC transporter permease [Gemmatimonadaceae bacterium]